MQKERIPTIDINKLDDSGQAEVLVRPFGAYLEQHHKNLAVAHRHNFYHLVFFTKGSGTHTIDFTRFVLQPGQIYFMIPGQVHSWDFEGEVDGFVANFTDDFFRSFLINTDYLEGFSFFNGIAADNVIDLPEHVAREISVLFQKMLSQAPGGVFQKDMLRLLLLEIFITVDQTTLTRREGHIPPHNYKVIKGYLKLIEQHFLELRLPSQYAELLSVTPNHLNAVCKAYFGEQAGELIRNRIVLEAKRLLVNLSLSVSEVGFVLNFNDSSYFTKFFRKYTGQTPEEFRRTQLQQH